MTAFPAAPIVISVTREEWADPAIPLPEYQSAGAAGADLRANLRPDDRALGLTLMPMARVLCPLGLCVAIPDGYEMQVRPRSGLSFRHGVTLVNAPGTIDCDYRGPLAVPLINLGAEPHVIRHGERIAQAVIAPVLRARFDLVAALAPSARGSGGFGSTGSL